MVHFHNLAYCGKAHPTLHGITCDLEVNHDGRHVHYDITMDGQDWEWEDEMTVPTSGEWLINRHGLYKCCVKFLRDYLSKTPTPAQRTRCPKCNGHLAIEGGVWRWKV